MQRRRRWRFCKRRRKQIPRTPPFNNGWELATIIRKRALLAVNLGVLVIGGSGAFLAPTVAAITLGIVGAGAFDKQFGKNQAFNSAGNVFTALLDAYVSYKFGYRRN